MKKSLVGINLESLYYYTRGLMYADAMKQAQGMFQQSPSDYSTMRKDGQPPADCCPLIATGMTPTFAGTYQFICNGQPQLAIKAGSGKITITGQTYSATMDKTTASINVPAAAIAELNQWALQIHNVTAGKVRNVQLFRPGAKTTDRFYNLFAQALTPFSVIRFMDALKTNGWGTNADGSPRADPIVKWADRMLPTDINAGDLPMCYEDVFGLGKLVGKDTWSCLPQSADDDHITQYMLLAKAQLSGTASHYVSWSNETWNYNMPQYKVTMALSQADPDPSLTAGGADINIRRYRWCAKQMVKVARAAMAAYGVKTIRDCPIRPVLDGQWANPQIIKYGLQWIEDNAGPVADYLYGIAIAPYAGLPSTLNLKTATADQILAAFLIGNAGDSNIQAHKNLATGDEIHLLGYELGTDTGQSADGLPAKIQAAYLQGQQAMIKSYLTNWQKAGGGLACWFTLTNMYTKYGQWGLTEDIGQLAAAPRFQGASAASAVLSWDDAPVTPPTPIPPTPPPATPLVSQETVNLNDGKLTVPITVNLLKGTGAKLAATGSIFSFTAGNETYSVETLLGPVSTQP